MTRPPSSPTLLPTRRSSDLLSIGGILSGVDYDPRSPVGGPARVEAEASQDTRYQIDRKSTRLNSSHVSISYAVFCLKKKTHDAGASRTSSQKSSGSQAPCAT